MTVLSRDGRNNLWFGTVDRMQWFPTPNRGADVSSQGWQDGGTMLNGGGYQLNSFGSAKNYLFEWPSSSSREAAQCLKSFSDGTYGRGLVYFLDPLTWDTNVLPAHWADPSMSLGLETPSLVPGVVPTPVSSTGSGSLNLPVRSASYDLTGTGEASTVKTTVASNYFTNPNFVGDGTWVEVKRNLVPWSMPSFNGSGWTANTGGTKITDPKGVKFLTGASNLTSGSSVNWSDIFPVTSGTRMGISIPVENVGGSTVHLAPGLSWHTSGGATTQVAEQSAAVILPPGDKATLFMQFEVPATAVTMRVHIRVGSAGVPAGSEVLMLDGVSSVANGETPLVFSGGSPARSVDPDMRQRWLGATNNSEAIMEGERVQGVDPVNALAIVSGMDGKPAMRVIANSASSKAYVRWNMTASAPRGSGVFTSTLHIPRPLSTAPTGSTLKIYAGVPNQPSPAAPNEAGSHVQVAPYTDLTSTFRLYWYCGQVMGDPDLYYTDPGLFDSGYNGPAFSGSSGPVTVSGETLETSWEGAVNNSVSVASRVTVSSSPLNESNSVFIPIPDGFELHLGAFYSSVNGSVLVSRVSLGGSVGSGVIAYPASSDSRFPTVLSKNPGDIGVRIWIAKTSPGVGGITLDAMHARLAPVGKTPPGPATWVGGQGHSGCRFVGKPTYINYTGVDGGQVGFAASFREVGAWQGAF